MSNPTRTISKKKSRLWAMVLTVALATGGLAAPITAFADEVTRTTATQAQLDRFAYDARRRMRRLEGEKEAARQALAAAREANARRAANARAAWRADEARRAANARADAARRDAQAREAARVVRGRRRAAADHFGWERARRGRAVDARPPVRSASAVPRGVTVRPAASRAHDGANDHRHGPSVTIRLAHR